MSDDNNNISKSPSLLRRNRADTLPSMNSIQQFNINNPTQEKSNLGNDLTSSLYRNRLSSYSINPTESTGSPSITKVNSWDDPFTSSNKSYQGVSKMPTSFLSHYESSAAKTLDFLGLNEELNAPTIPSPKLNASRRNRAMTLPGNNPLAPPFKSNRPPSMGAISDGESENTIHSPTSGQSTLLDGAQKDQDLECLSLKLENLSLDTTLSKLTVELSKYGDVESVQMVKKDGVGYVTFSNAEEAKNAQTSMNNKEFLESLLKVNFYREPANDQTNTANSSQGNLATDPSGLNQNNSGVSQEANSFYKKTIDYYNQQAEDFKLAIAEVSTRGLKKHELLMSYEYAVTLPPIPNPTFKKRVEPTRLRELRKLLESEPNTEAIDSSFEETKDSWVDLCSDYIGNIIIQKLIEHGTEEQKTILINSVAPYMAAIGIHKNGTWAIQKMIECADTDAQVVPIAAALKPFTPALLLDQFGNYVVQCCLKFESPNNQFIFDAIYSRCSEIAQGRYGARAIRTCLDSQFTTQKQKELVSEALMRNAYSLSTNANGSLLLNWILDSQFTEHYMGIVVNLSGHLSQLCCHKLASSIIVRLINQQLDSQAREYLLYKLFFQNSGPVIKDILTDYSQGNQFVQKILNSPYLDEETKASIQMSVTKYNSQYIDHQQLMGYRRLLFDEAMAHSGHFLQNQTLPIQHDPNFPSFNPGMNPGMPNTQDNPGNWSWGWNSQAQTQATLPNYITSMSTPSPNLFNQNNSYFMPTTAASINPGSVQPNEPKDSKTSTSYIALNIN